MSATYTKLKSGDWGIRSASPLREGESVVVRKKDGSSRTETVTKVLWSGDGVWLAAVARSGQRSGGELPRGHHRCRNGHAPHAGPCCSGRHRGGDDCGCDCCDLD